MTANRRIFLNIVATYGRSLYALVIGLFCGRWTLTTLGEMDCGLMVSWAAAKYGKIYGKGVNEVRQRLRRFGRATGARIRSAADYCINATVSMKAEPLGFVDGDRIKKRVNLT